jgi:apolipoprotein N-acyltransferase
LTPALLAASIGSGILVALAFPPFGFHFLAWVALVPFLAALARAGSTKSGALLGLAFGVAFFGLDLSWIYQTVVVHGHFHPVLGAVTFVALVATLSLYTALFGFALAVFPKLGHPSALVAPFLWVALEYLRSVFLTGFPWDLLGYSQAGFLTLIQIADITGAFGVSFIIVLVNSVFTQLTDAVFLGERLSFKSCAFASCCLSLVVLYGHVRVQEWTNIPESASRYKVGALQGNIPQELKWNESSREATFSIYEALGLKATHEGAKLLIWPETSVPVLFGSSDPDWKKPGEISERLGAPMLIGAPVGEMIEGSPHYYNSALLVNGERIIARYDKIHLVPFGEYMPLSWLLPLGPGIAARDLDYSEGREMTVMSAPGSPRFSVLICYEAIFPELASRAVRDGAQFLVNITNDGWFGNSGAPYQHLAMAGLRSVENRIWLLRSANNGISAAFDPAGRMVSSIPLSEAGEFTANVSVTDGPKTFYCRWGNIFALACALFCAIPIIGRGRAWMVNFSNRSGRV